LPVAFSQRSRRWVSNTHPGSNEDRDAYVRNAEFPVFSLPACRTAPGRLVGVPQPVCLRELTDDLPGLGPHHSRRPCWTASFRTYPPFSLAISRTPPSVPQMQAPGKFSRRRTNKLKSSFFAAFAYDAQKVLGGPRLRLERRHHLARPFKFVALCLAPVGRFAGWYWSTQ